MRLPTNAGDDRHHVLCCLNDCHNKEKEDVVMHFDASRGLTASTPAVTGIVVSFSFLCLYFPLPLRLWLTLSPAMAASWRA